MQTQVHQIIIGLAIFTFNISNASGQTTQGYPKITGYVGIVHPIVSFSADGTHTNFKDSYVAGMPIGINIWKNSKIGFSSEIVPIINATSNSSKVSNVLFQPGILVALGSGFIFAGRLAFETSGRYGVTPVINKTLKKNKSTSYFIAMPLPARFGNGASSSFGVGFQFGVGF